MPSTKRRRDRGRKHPTGKANERKEDILFLLRHNEPMERIASRLGLHPQNVERYMRELKKDSEESFKIVVRWYILQDLDYTSPSVRADIKRYYELLRR